jgi:hypothetical protein
MGMMDQISGLRKLTLESCLQKGGGASIMGFREQLSTRLPSEPTSSKALFLAAFGAEFTPFAHVRRVC